MATDSPLLVQKDSRGRVSLGALLAEGHYLASRDAEGRVILEPAVVMTASERRLLADESFVSRMSEAAREDVEPLDLDEL